MKGYSFSVTVNAISLIIFFLLVSYSMNVEGRTLKDHSHTSFINLITNQAYTGPSRRGEGH
ncbi:hypothetical protein Lalb_Chr21g0308291 [Lupinus albus]|uniref:Transmembrane protein n=1 Tax=Lupinus albus TaxID=3870 RepID=A0A6A4NS35_LUPAL|nr:hypothetical protein Lalb_Chr21g0308291 [Lupinus albus]